MSKLKIEFNLPEEQHEADIVTNAHKLHNAIHEFMNHIRNKKKHGSDEEQEAYESVSKAFYDCIEDNNVSHLF